jgi:hypothetical protein
MDPAHATLPVESSRGGKVPSPDRALSLLKSVPPKRRDIVAKDLTASRILLSLYFTIFLNQLDNLLAYTENGTFGLAPG